MSQLERECLEKLLDEHTNDAKFPYFGELHLRKLTLLGAAAPGVINLLAIHRFEK